MFEKPKLDSEKFKPKEGVEAEPVLLIDDFAAVLPSEEREELRSLYDLMVNVWGSQGEEGLEIDHSNLSEDDEKKHERFYTLLKKAEEIVGKEFSFE